MYVGGSEIKVMQHVFIDLFHHAWPFLVSIVRAPLMQQDTLDDTHLLGFLGHLDNTSVRVTAIVIFSQGHPPLAGIVFHLLFIQVFIEHLDRTAAHGHGNDANLLVWQFSNHRTTEIVCRTQFSIRADNGTLCSVPITFCTLWGREVAGG